MAGIRTIGCTLSLWCALLVGFVLVVLSLQFMILLSSSATLMLGGMKNIVGQSDDQVVVLLNLLTDTPISYDITVNIEMIEELDKYYVNWFSRIEEIATEECTLPNNSTCIWQHARKNVDVVFRQAAMYVHNGSFPFRYCDRQIVAAMNTEAEIPEIMEPLKNADMRVDHHPKSEITMTEACGIPWKEGIYETPDPSGRKGVALLMSNCGVQWRNDYIKELMKYIHIDSYGHCFHNVPEPPSRENFVEAFQVITKKYRMVVTFENTINSDYISEKICHCYRAGVIPVYWGPPEIYQWVPGNHSFIDPQRFKGPKELAEYLKKINEDDDLFKYHTTHFNYTSSFKMHEENCNKAMYCHVCEIAHAIKVERGKQGIVPRTCLP